MLQKASVGRSVHYVLATPEGEEPVIRPAIIVRVWNDETGMCNLQVFTDGTNDQRHGTDGSGTLWATSREYSEEYRVGTWHWMPRV